MHDDPLRHPVLLQHASLIDGIAEAVAIDEADRRIVHANGAFCRMFERTPGEIAGIHTDELVAPEWREVLDARHRARMRGEPSEMLYEFEALGRTGRRFWVEVSVLPILAGGRIIGTQSALRDLTERRKKAERLDDLLKHDYRQLFDHASDGIVIFEPETERILDANPRFCEVHQYTREELIGRSMKEFTVDVAKGEAMIVTVQRKGAIRDFQTVHIRKDGTHVFLESTAALTHYGGAPVILGMSRDVTEKRMMEEELRHAQKLEAMALLAGGVAHDFNNLLVNILAAAELLHTGACALEERSTLVADILAAAQRGRTLTQELLAFNRKQPFQSKRVRIDDLVDGALSWLRRTIAASVRFERRFGAGAAHVEVDAHLIECALVNMVINARDAMPHGGVVTFTTSVEELSAEQTGAWGGRPGPYVVVSVTDTGVGMDPQTLAKIFTPYFTTKQSDRGTGLGLSTAFGVVRQHGGTITAESTPGKGSTFTVYLPQCPPVVRATTVPPPQLQDIAASSSRKRRVLLVEDDDSVRRTLARVLKAGGFEVTEASSAEEALSFVTPAELRRFALLLSDVSMPGLSGADLARRLRQHRPELPVLFVSGHHEEELGSFDATTTSFVGKPFSAGELVLAVQRLLADQDPSS